MLSFAERVFNTWKRLSVSFHIYLRCCGKYGYHFVSKQIPNILQRQYLTFSSSLRAKKIRECIKLNYYSKTKFHITAVFFCNGERCILQPNGLLQHLPAWVTVQSLALGFSTHALTHWTVVLSWKLWVWIRCKTFLQVTCWL